MQEINNVRMWSSEIDEKTRLQAERTARLPILAGPLALMSDAHLGIGATVGSVVITDGAIIPAAVGVDVGCGMIAVETSILAIDLPDSLQPLVHQLGRSIPSGVGQGRNLKSKGISDQKLLTRAASWLQKHPHNTGEASSIALSQLGTLGSGNHFIEITLDERDVVWALLHSGSRNIGNRLADRHIKLAKLQEQALEDRDLAYFLEGQPEFRDYISDMIWAQSYALENREMMMDVVLSDLFAFVGKGTEVDRINCHHNFATQEIHNGKLVWVTRKGAIRAGKGDRGLIPGSMGTASYIVEGLGNPLSYNSSSHGAGRRMSRGQAKRELTPESLVRAMEGKAWTGNAQALLDEHPDSYKDISAVMKDQLDLTKVVHELHQVLNYKGV